MAKGGLGKGLGAIFGEDINRSAVKAEVKKSVKKADREDVSRETSVISISLIEPNRRQPRTVFDEEKIAELADSIRKHGVIQPVVVRPAGRGYELIVGERRWRAAREAGLKEIPAIVREIGEREAAELALIENLQREDLGPVEEARAYKALIETYGLKQEELAEKLSRSRSSVTNSMRLLQLEDEILAMLEDGRLSAGHARALLGLDKGAARLELAREIAEKDLSVRETEERVRKLRKGAPAKKEKKDEDIELYLSDLSRKLTESLKTKVVISGGKKGAGKIRIDYYNEDDLNRILGKLR